VSKIKSIIIKIIRVITGVDQKLRRLISDDKLLMDNDSMKRNTGGGKCFAILHEIWVAK